MRKTLKQLFAGHQRQNRVPQKLSLLIVVDLILTLARLLRLLLSRLRAVSECLLDHRTAVEVVGQRCFQRRNFPFLHDDLLTELLTTRAGLRPVQFLAGGAPPLLNCVSRSFSLRAASPAFVPSLVNPTAWLAYFRASGYLFCISNATESRNTAIGSGSFGNASIDFRKFPSASAQAFALKSIVPKIAYASGFT